MRVQAWSIFVPVLLLLLWVEVMEVLQPALPGAMAVRVEHLPTTPAAPQTATYIPSVNANGSIALKLTTLGGCVISANKAVFVNGQTTWLGISTDWGLGSNWSNGVIPISCTKVIVPNGKPFMPTLTGIDNMCYSLSVQPGATVNMATGAKLLITGKNSLNGPPGQLVRER